MSTSNRPAKPRNLLQKAPSCRRRRNCLDGVGETVWIDVIRKMDEVHNDSCSTRWRWKKNAALEESHQFIESVLASMSDIPSSDRHGNIEEVNPSLQRFIGKAEAVLKGSPLFDLFADEGSRRAVRDFFSPQGCAMRATTSN